MLSQSFDRQALLAISRHERPTSLPPGAPPGGASRAALLEQVLGGAPLPTSLQGARWPLTASDAHAAVFTSEPEIVVPGLLLLPPGSPARAVVIGVHPEGKQGLLGRREVAQLRAAGVALLLLDYRGVGETRPSDAWNPRRSLMLGRHLLGLQAWDLRRALDWIEQQPDLRLPVLLWGEGGAALVALVAAACDERFRGVAVTDLIASFAGEVDGALIQDQCPWRLLEWGDVRDAAALVAPRGLRVVNPRDGRGRPLGAPAAAAHFGGAAVVDTERPAREHVVPFLLSLLSSAER
jgi:hypothetical protein